MDIETQAAAWTEIRERFTGWVETPNGPGSTLEATQNTRRELPALLTRHNIRKLLDAPCGDWNWLSKTVLPKGLSYIGWDIDETFIARNKEEYGKRGRKFENANLLTVEAIPEVDAVMCRDFLIHLPNENILALLEKFRAGAKYLIATHSPGKGNARPCPEEGHDGRPGYWCHRTDLEAEPFGLTKIDGFTEYRHSELALFEL